MARITVEDCLHQCNNRFELTLMAAKRARQIALGKDEPRVDPDNDKPTVIALREIAHDAVNNEIIHEIDQQPVEPQMIMTPMLDEDDFLD